MFTDTLNAIQMDFIYFLCLCCCLVRIGISAPLQEYSGENTLMDDLQFTQTVTRGRTLIKKILDDINKSHVHSETLNPHTSNKPQNLQYMVTYLNIPSAPVLKEISADFTIETCLSRMSEGLQMYQDLLETLRGKVATPGKIAELQVDVKELLALILKMSELVQLETGVQYQGSGLASRLEGEYNVQVAAHLILTQLQNFIQDVFRSLRNIDQTKSGPRG